MSRTLQCANVQTLGNAHSHITPESRTLPRTLDRAIGLKALAGAVIGRTLPRTLPAHYEQTPRTLPAHCGQAPHIAKSHGEADLVRRIRVMAARWQYTPDELALVLEGAKADPEGWLGVVTADEGCRDGEA